MTDIYSAYRALPGKTGKGDTHLPLWIHLEDTASIMEYLCRTRVSAAVIRASGLDAPAFLQMCEFLARIHDMGKCTPVFVSKILTAAPFCRGVLQQYGIDVPYQEKFAYERKVPHALAGEVILRSLGCPDGICSVVGAHHGKPSSSREETYRYEMHIATAPISYHAEQDVLWHDMQKMLLDNAMAQSGYCTTEDIPVLSNCAQIILSGLLIQADWIASNTDYFPLLDADDDGSSLVQKDRVEWAISRISLPAGWDACYKNKDNKQFFFNRFGFSPNSMQKAALSVAESISGPGGLMIIEAQMGVGKTEAALGAAEILAAKNGCEGVFFGLPTQATSNGLFPRMAHWAEKASLDGKHTIRLVHGMAELNKDYQMYFADNVNVEADGTTDNQLVVHSWFSGKKQALLADFVVGTVDTALMSALKQKHVMLRHLGLCGKVIVIDECHAYDAYMSRFLLRMLHWLGAYHVPVILLSATLPEKKKREMLQAYSEPYKEKIPAALPFEGGYPLLTWTDSNGVSTKAINDEAGITTVTIERKNEESIIDSLKDRLSEGGCVGIIVNTVIHAQALAARLTTVFPDKKIYVYHAQFIARERIRRENELISMIGKGSSSEKRDNVIVIGTQVLEQSLDIDFDYLITDLCPMDLLLQRIGRLHRHIRKRPNPVSSPICTIICTENEYNIGGVKIYGEWLLKQTSKYLPAKIQLPCDIPSLVNRVYADPDDVDRDDSWEAFHNRTEIKEDRANDWCLPLPKHSRRVSGNSIVGLLDSCLESEKKAEASVRDGMPSVDVLLMYRIDDEHIGFTLNSSETTLRADSVPSEEDAKKIILQKLRLPFIFGMGENLDKVINTLEEENSKWLSQWQDSPWLKGELILLFDKKGERDLCGYHLQYEKDFGLQYERIGE